jgi:hypothetical protein
MFREHFLGRVSALKGQIGRLLAILRQCLSAIKNVPGTFFEICPLCRPTLRKSGLSVWERLCLLRFPRLLVSNNSLYPDPQAEPSLLFQETSLAQRLVFEPTG